MKWPWSKAKVSPEEKREAEPERIMFCASDLPMQRAQKIWRALGFVNDGLNAIPALCGFLSMYRDWDVRPQARPASEWHEDLGNVIWWRLPVTEPPYVGTPYDDTWILNGWDNYYTHFTLLVIPANANETNRA